MIIAFRASVCAAVTSGDRGRLGGTGKAPRYLERVACFSRA
jgi:hypothetical protein